MNNYRIQFKSSAAKKFLKSPLSIKQRGGQLIMKYTIVIQWSHENNYFVIFLPEFENVMQPVTHSATYQEAFDNAQEVLELLLV